MSLERALDCFQSEIDGLSHGVHPQIEFDVVGVELRHLHGLTDEAVESGRLLFDDLHHLSRFVPCRGRGRCAVW